MEKILSFSSSIIKKIFLARSLRVLLYSVFFISIIKWQFFEIYQIPSDSMSPTLWSYDFILVDKLTYGLRVPFTNRWLWSFREPVPGEVIVFRSKIDDEKFYVKRVLGTYGDRIDSNIEGHTIVNGILPSKPCDNNNSIFQTWFVREENKNIKDFLCFQESLGMKSWTILLEKGRMRFEMGQKKVGPSQVWVQGDNRDNSVDSRSWGPISRQDLMGKVTKIIFHYNSRKADKKWLWERFFLNLEDGF